MSQQTFITAQANTPRLLIICHDRIGSRMAGPGIRAWEMARVLAAQQPVTLVAPQPIDLEATGLALGQYAWGTEGSLQPWLFQADLVVANGHVLDAHPEVARFTGPLVLDLYDPILLENFELLRHAAADVRAERFARDQALLVRQLARGDFLLCATERQRDLYLGGLLSAGRITPELTDADPEARSLIDVVPFGLSSQPPLRQGPALRGIVPGIGADDLLLLWTGGMWDWLDPLTLIRAMPQLIAQHPTARLVFLAGKHPGSAQPMRVPQLARELADQLDLTGRHVFFYDAWVPYEQRADVLLDADVAVSLHHAHLETRYAAVRSRFLDHLWAGLPSVVTDGDAAADLVRQHDLGRVVPPDDADALAIALDALLSDREARRRYAQNARQLAEHYTWERVVQPLASFCRRPVTMKEPLLEAALQAAELPPETMTRQQAVAAVDALWNVQPQELGSSVPLIGEAKRTANSLTRWYVQPIVEQQNAFNAAVVHALQALAVENDAQSGRLSSLLYELTQAVSRLGSTIEHLTRSVEHAHHEIELMNRKIEQLRNESAVARQHIADIETHLCDLDDAQTALAQRIASQTDEQP